MQFTSSIYKHILEFNFSAGTSRGILHQKPSWFIKLCAAGRCGIGEAGPLAGLSSEGTDLDATLASLAAKFDQISAPANEQEVYEEAAKFSGGVASVRFALETALLDWLRGGRKMLYETSFSAGLSPVPINGLIWMADRETMRKRIDEKLQQGFSCLKLKIGAIDFEEELALLKYIRSHYKADTLSIRVDANGAFLVTDALHKLDRLAEWELHSIEQPIRQGQEEAMQQLCRQTPIPIALDEELIGVQQTAEKHQLLNFIQPQYIILKPSLVGGLAASKEWVDLAEAKGIGWWITSALESNIGLNAIAQFTAMFDPDMPQGLGTGQLYTNNFDSPLEVKSGYLHYSRSQQWDLSFFDR